ncbi:fumarylacetoacetate hydrolase family protein [Alicyclobacillus tolerans]|uniref:fumarylacetoacetate hydrolase family protein n=1 Tax=Alicyclobacillus tolerans TaxID=90970 RepID=UPI001F48D03B|nr:fumarylacetoacetate hydrolase family protein [Alicyclobacillus tolerans]MCF8565579.1 fumarylacetoacetate hydrolase family protein [Alicyclobacillus tolerans]
MKWVTFRDETNRLAMGVLSWDSTVVDVQRAARDLGHPGCTEYRTVLDVLRDRDGVDKVAALVNSIGDSTGPWRLPVADVKVTAPIPRPGKVLGVALNYYDFCTRGQLNPPTALKVFTKVSTAVIGPDERIGLPHGRKVTYEGELGVVIGKPGKDIRAADALDYVAGYTIVNDYTANDFVKEDVQLTRGKNLDGFCPMGPALVTKDEVFNPHSLSIVTTVNEFVRQESNTSQMIFKIEDIIEFFSSFLTLEPGDVIATGTPAGTALQYDPPAFVQAGDTVSVTIAGLGTLTNHIVHM